MSRQGDPAPRIRSTIAALAATLVLTLSMASSSVTPTAASWADAEWVAQQLGSLDCATGSGQFSSRAAGRMLTGELPGTNLDDVAELQGVLVENTGDRSSATPATAVPLGADTFSAPLGATALTALQVTAGGLISIPLGTPAGILANHGRATGDGVSVGAAGAVNDAGVIDLDAASPSSDPPGLATIELGRLLDSLVGKGLGGGVSNLTDSSLEVGAVGASSTLDACSAQWTGRIYDVLAREYLVSSLDLGLDSPVVASTSGAVGSVAHGVEGSVEALRTQPAFVASVRAGVTQLVRGLLQTLALGDVRVTSLDVALELGAVDALLDDTISDSEQMVTIDLAKGTATVDLDALLGAANSTDGVNGLDPNTRLLIDDEVVSELTAATTEALTGWIADVSAALSSALRVMTVTAQVQVDLVAALGGPPVATITLRIPATPLSTLLLGGTKATAAVALLGGTCSALNALGCVVNSVVAGIVGPLTNGIGRVVAQAIDVAVFNMGGILDRATASMLARTAPMVTFVSDATASLFGENSVLSLTVNAQNLPDPRHPGGPDLPDWADSVPGPDPVSGVSGQYDVAALRVAGAGLLGDGAKVSVDFARASSGSNRVRR